MTQATVGVDARVLGRRGVGRYLSSLLEAMVRRSPSTRFILFVGSKTERAYIPSAPNVHPVELPDRHAALLEQRDIPRLAKAHACHLLHCPDNTAPLRSPIPVVLTMHDSMWRRPLWQAVARPGPTLYLQDLYRKWVCPRAAHRAAAVITISDYSRQDLKGSLKLPASKLHVIPEAVSPLMARALPGAKAAAYRRELGLAQPYVLASGAADRRKNIDRLIRAFARAKAAGGPLAKAALVITSLRHGEEGTTTYMQTASMAGVAADIKLPGYVSDEEMKALYQGALCFAFPSLWEGFGLPVLEAYALGCPVVASGGSALRETAGAGALFVMPKDESEIAEALVLACKKDVAARMRAAGRKELRRFSWDRAARQTLAVYAAVLGNRS